MAGSSGVFHNSISTKSVSSKFSSVGGSKPHLLVAPLLAAGAAATGAAGTGGLAENALLSLTRPKRPA